MEKVKLQTKEGVIEGMADGSLYAAKLTEAIFIKFKYEGSTYNYKFSRKTGKLYGSKLPFEIRLILE